MSSRYKIKFRKKNGKMNGFIPNGSDADWSDEDAVKSGSATGFSETEQDDAITKKQQAIITAKSLNGKKYDPVNLILDKIDAELSSLSKSQSSSATGGTVVKKPGGKHRKTSGGDHSNSPRSGGSSHKSEGTDTGLGSSSLPSERDHRKINGSTELYSDTEGTLTDRDEDGQKKGIPSDLDSVSAQQVDAKFKEIMRKKKGGYLENLKTGPGVSDAETVKTEDYEKKFREALVTLSDSDTLENARSEADDESGTVTISDTESNHVDDMSWDYFDTIPQRPATVPKTSSGYKNKDSKSTSLTQGMKNDHMTKNNKRTPDSSPVTKKNAEEGMNSSRNSRRDLNSTPPIYPRSSSNSPKSPRQSTEKLKSPWGKRKQGYISDADSIRTEDFEVRFHELIIKQPPESEGDTTDNDPLHIKVKDILRATAPLKKKTGFPTNNSRGRSSPDKKTDLCSDKDKRHKQSSVTDLEQTDYLFNWNDPFWDTSADHKKNPISSSSSDSSKEPIFNRRITFQKSNSCCNLNSSTSSGYPYFSSTDDLSSLSTFHLDDKDFSSFDRDHHSLRDPEHFWSENKDNTKHEVRLSLRGNPSLNKKKYSLTYGQNSSVDWSDSSQSVGSSSFDSKKSLIIPDDNEEYPFARFTFNKKPDIQQRSTSVSGPDPWSSHSSNFSGSISLNDYSLNSQSVSKPAFFKSDSESSISSDSSSSSSDFNLPSTYNSISLDSLYSFPDNHQEDLVIGSVFHSQDPSSMFPSPFNEGASDQFFYDLGFAGVENFLPERFARDWYEKIKKSKQEMIQQQRYVNPYQYHNLMYNSIYSRNPSSQAERNSPNTIENNTQNKPSYDDESVKSKRQSQIEEGSSTIEKLRQILQKEMVLSNKKELMLDKVKEKRLHQFTRSRQQSLPVYLSEDKESLIRGARSETNVNEQTKHQNTLTQSRQTSDWTNPEAKPALKETSKIQDSRKHSAVPTILVADESSNRENLLTSDSLEVEEILVGCNLNNNVSNRHSEGARSNLQVLSSNYLHADTDFRHLTSSPASSRSASNASPAIFSPVTVIEANLDNRNESLDVEDSQHSACHDSFDINYGGKFRHSSQVISNSLGYFDDSFNGGRKSPVCFYLDSGHLNVSDFKRRNSCVDNMSTAKEKEKMVAAFKNRRPSLPVHNNIYRTKNPEVVFSNTMESLEFYESEIAGSYDNNEATVCMTPKGHPDLSLRKVSVMDKFQERPLENSNSNEISVQADDGLLTPILTFSDADHLMTTLKMMESKDTVFCICQDKETQYDPKIGQGQMEKNGYCRDGNNSITEDILVALSSSPKYEERIPHNNKQDSNIQTDLQIEVTSQGNQTEPISCCCCCHSNRTGSTWWNVGSIERQPLSSKNNSHHHDTIGYDYFRSAVNGEDFETFLKPDFPMKRNSHFPFHNGALSDENVQESISRDSQVNGHMSTPSCARDNFLMASAYWESFDNDSVKLSRMSSLDIEGSVSSYPEVYRQIQQDYCNEFSNGQRNDHCDDVHRLSTNQDEYELGDFNNTLQREHANGYCMGRHNVRSPLGDDNSCVTRSIHWVNSHSDENNDVPQQRFVSCVCKFVPLLVSVERALSPEGKSGS